MNFWIALGLATLFLIITIIVFATKFLFPYHRIVALIIYGIGWIPFLYSIYIKRQFIIEQQGTITSFLSAFWIHILFGIGMLISLYIFLIIFPAVKSPFTELSDDEISTRLTEDETLILYLDERLDNLFNESDKNNIFTIDFNNIRNDQKESLNKFWISYLEVMLELDLLKERYKTFYQLNALTKRDLHKKAFKNGYTSFLAQHYYTLRLQQRVYRNDRLISYLNDQIPKQGVDKDTYTKIVDKLTDPDELIRLNTGRAYNKTLGDNGSKQDFLIKKYIDGIDKSISSYVDLISNKPLNFLERNSFNLWFPIQKQFAVQISYVRTANRDYHITPEQISGYRDKLLPGDILLERREWHATNVGIPGFWTHSALYIGTLDYLDKYFEDLPTLSGKKFSEFLEENYSEAFEGMSRLDENNYKYSVIESKRPGVIFMSLEESANADSLGVLRVKGMNLEERFRIITQAINHIGKPYDFDFNFVTDSALVCSELVYKAYQDIENLNIEPQILNGRPIVSPNDFAEKFDSEFGSNSSEMELVLFLDGNEKEGVAIEKGAEEFVKSWKRPKWHIAKDFLNFE